MPPSAPADSGARLFADLVAVVDATASSPVILHAPHGGRVVPPRFRGAFTVSDASLAREHDALVDHFTDRLVAAALGARVAAAGGGADDPRAAARTVKSPRASAVINGLSRFIVDVERFPDETEEKNAVGQGVLYTHGAWRDLIREVPPSDVEPLMAFYAAYAATVERLVDAALAVHGTAIVIDVHSFNADPLPHELHAAERRPELCVGFEEFHADPTLLDAVDQAFAGRERVANEPFHGAYVPLKHYRADSRVQSVMLEIRRDLYMDEDAVIADATALARLAAELGELISRVTPPASRTRSPRTAPR